MLPAPPGGRPICTVGLDSDRVMEKALFVNQIESIWQRRFMYIAVVLLSKIVCVCVCVCQMSLYVSLRVSLRVSEALPEVSARQAEVLTPLPPRDPRLLGQAML